MSIMTRLFAGRKEAETNEDQVRHVLRRLTFGPTNDQLDRFEGWEVNDVIDALLDDAPIEVTLPDTSMFDDEEAETPDLSHWWFRIMGRSDAGVHERMVWFWHGLITTSLDKASPPDMGVNHLLLRRNALGNLRTMLQEVTLDPSMLFWLDGSNSYADAPNENYAREVMELFALGRFSDAYTEDDVKAGAKALAGYWVDDAEENLNADGSSTVRPIDDDAFLDGSVSFLGTRVSTAEDVINAICDHPQCARYIVGKVYESFFGNLPSEGRIDELASSFRSSGLEISVLVRDVVADPDLLADPLGRPRSPVEWALGVERLVDREIDPWVLEELGQIPMLPPNVAGWPGTSRWVSAAAALAKSNVMTSYAWDGYVMESDDLVAEVIGRAGLAYVSPSTRQALEDVAAVDSDSEYRSMLLFSVIGVSPEFSLT